MPEQLMGMLVQNPVEVRGDDGTRIHHGIAERLRRSRWLASIQTASRPNAGSPGGDTVERTEHLPGLIASSRSG